MDELFGFHLTYLRFYIDFATIFGMKLSLISSEEKIVEFTWILFCFVLFLHYIYWISSLVWDLVYIYICLGPGGQMTELVSGPVDHLKNGKYVKKLSFNFT